MHDHFRIDAVRGLVYGKRGRPASQRNPQGYIQLCINNRYYGVAHRVIWESVNGPIPEGMHIDHINGIKDDNRIENLRLCTVSQNQMNRRVLQGAVRSKGVTRHKGGKFQAQIKADGRRMYLGLFDSESMAAAAYQAAANRYFGEYAATEFTA